MSWLVYAGLSALFAGLVAIFGKIGVRGVDSTVATTVRAGVMLLALLATVGLRGNVAEVAQVDRRTMLFLVLSGLAGAASWVCYFRALQLGDALRVAPIDRLSGAVTLILAAILLHERAPASAWLGTALMLVGAVMVARS
jgi:bacterial/archaeal transporter family protein